MKRKIYPFLIILSGIIFIIILTSFKKKPSIIKQKIVLPVVKVASFNAETRKILIKGNGTLEAKDKVNIASQVSGEILKISKKMSDFKRFEKGDTLFVIDPTEYELRIKNAEAIVLQQKMALKMEKINKKIADLEWQAHKKINPKAVCDSMTLRIPQLEIAKANYQSALATLKISELNLQRTIIIAPFAGMLIMKNISTGQIVSPGVTLAQICSINKATLKISVINDELKWIGKKIGQPTQIFGNYYGEEYLWKGKLIGIEPFANQGSRMSNLIIETTNPMGKNQNPPFGLFVRAEVEARKIDNITAIPRHLLKNKNEIIVINNEDKIEFKRVNILRFEEDLALIDGGINGKDRLLISTLETATPNTKVRIIKDNTAKRNGDEPK